MLTYETAIALGVSEAFQNEELAAIGGVEAETLVAATADFARMDSDEVHENGCADAEGLYEWAYSYAINN